MQTALRKNILNACKYDAFKLYVYIRFQVACQDVAFQFSKASFHTVCCDKGYTLGITTCPKSLFTGKQGHITDKIHVFPQIIFIRHLNIMHIINISQS